VTAVSPPPSWYADPTGRHQSRFWDGFTWTAQVADGPNPGHDPLVQPTGPATDALPPLIGSPGSGGHSALLATSARNPVADRMLVGHGTAALRLMAETGPGVDVAGRARPVVVDSRTDDAAAARRRRRALIDGAALVGAVVLVGVIVALLSANGVFTRDPNPTVAETGAVFRGDGYRAVIPPSWIAAQPMPGAGADMSYTVVASAPTLGLVGTDAANRTSVTDPAQLEQLVVAGAQSPVSVTGATMQVVATETVEQGDRPIAGVTVDVIGPDGSTRRMVRYMVVGPEKSVTIAVTGEPDAITRAGREARAVAKSVRFR